MDEGEALIIAYLLLLSHLQDSDVMLDPSILSSGSLQCISAVIGINQESVCWRVIG